MHISSLTEVASLQVKPAHPSQGKDKQDTGSPTPPRWEDDVVSFQTPVSRDPMRQVVGRIPYLDSRLLSPHKLGSLIPGISGLLLLLLTTSLTLLERPGPIPGAS